MRIIGDTFDLITKIGDDKHDFIIADPPYDLDLEKQLFLHNHFLRICKGTIIVFAWPKNPWPIKPSQKLLWVKATSTKNNSKSYSQGFVEDMYVYYGKNSYWNSNLHWSNYTGVYDDRVDNIKLHPHRKPPSMINRFILIHTRSKAKIFDPFAGSGVVENVCNRLERRYYGIDLHERDYWKTNN